MDFEQRLQRAVERGKRTGDQRERDVAEQAISEEEYKRLHSQYRLALSERIENCVRQTQHHFPGFRFETVVGERGWGATITRDDLQLERGRRNSMFSRLEMVVRPFSPLHVMELTAKGTIRNREIYNRSHYQRLTEADLTSFEELIDLWVLEYAELYAASR